MANAEAWLALGHRLYEKGKAIFDHSDLIESDAGTADPKVVALTLLAMPTIALVIESPRPTDTSPRTLEITPFPAPQTAPFAFWQADCA